MIASLIGLALGLQATSEWDGLPVTADNFPPAALMCANGETDKSPGYDGLYTLVLQRQPGKNLVRITRAEKGELVKVDLPGGLKTIATQTDGRTSRYVLKGSGRSNNITAEFVLRVKTGGETPWFSDLTLTWNGAVYKESCKPMVLPPNIETSK